METSNALKVIVNKLERMQGYFVILEPMLLSSDPEILADSKTLSAIERMFQLIVDAAIDINTTIIQEEKAQPADDYQGTFELVAQCGALPRDLAFAMSPSVGLRNILVHVYEKIDPAQEIHSIKHGIDQYRQYMKHIFEYVEKKKNKV